MKDNLGYIVRSYFRRQEQKNQPESYLRIDKSRKIEHINNHYLEQEIDATVDPLDFSKSTKH